MRAFRPLFVAVAHQRQAEEAVPFPGAIALLRGLRRAGVPAGIVSTKKGDVIEQIAHRWGVEDDLALIVGGELAVCFDLPFGITALCVAAGEAGVLLTLGTALCVLIDRRGKQFFRA